MKNGHTEIFNLFPSAFCHSKEVKEQWFSRVGGRVLWLLTRLKSTAVRCGRKLAHSSNQGDRPICLISRMWWDIENYMPGKKSKAFSVFPLASKPGPDKRKKALKSYWSFSLPKQTDISSSSICLQQLHKGYIPIWWKWTGMKDVFCYHLTMLLTPISSCRLKNECTFALRLNYLFV